MAKFNFEIAIEPRAALGKGASRRLRREENKVLGVIYGADEAPVSVQMNHYEITKALQNDAIYSHILMLTEGSKKQRVVLKDIQRHPYKPRILHMDFLRVDENKPITMHVPIHFIGEAIAPGVTKSGGTITHYMIEVGIKCLPRDLPEHIDVDLTNAELDTVVHLSQLPLPKNVELLNVVHGHDDDLPVVAIHLPKRVEETEDTTAPAASEVPATNVKADAKPAPAAKSKGKNDKK